MSGVFFDVDSLLGHTMGITFLTDKKKGPVFPTAKRILERFGIQTSSSFDKSVFLILKPICYFFGACFLSVLLLEFFKS